MLPGFKLPKVETAHFVLLITFLKKNKKINKKSCRLESTPFKLEIPRRLIFGQSCKSILKRKIKIWTEETAQRLGAFAALADGLILVPAPV